MTIRLETITNLATLLTCVAIVAFLMQRGEREPPGTPSTLPTYAAGESITGIPEVQFASANRTLLLAASESCQYCQESMPFYKTLAARFGANPASSVQVVLVTTDDEAASKRFLLASGLNTATVIRLAPEQFRALKVPGTPTLVLADHGGKVMSVWVGKLNTDRERQVLDALAGQG